MFDSSKYTYQEGVKSSNTDSGLSSNPQILESIIPDSITAFVTVVLLFCFALLSQGLLVRPKP